MSGVSTVNHGPGVIVRAANHILGLSAGLCLGLFLLMVIRHGWSWHYLLFLALAGILAGSLKLPGHVRMNSEWFNCLILVACYLGEMVRD